EESATVKELLGMMRMSGVEPVSTWTRAAAEAVVGISDAKSKTTSRIRGFTSALLKQAGAHALRNSSGNAQARSNTFAPELTNARSRALEAGLQTCLAAHLAHPVDALAQVFAAPLAELGIEVVGRGDGGEHRSANAIDAASR